jgi:hypothetical protein
MTLAFTMLAFIDSFRGQELIFQEGRQLLPFSNCIDGCTVPFDVITDCSNVELAGNECICIPLVLFKKGSDTVSSCKEQHEPVIAAWRDPRSFKKLV